MSLYILTTLEPFLLFRCQCSRCGVLCFMLQVGMNYIHLWANSRLTIWKRIYIRAQKTFNLFWERHWTLVNPNARVKVWPWGLRHMLFHLGLRSFLQFLRCEKDSFQAVASVRPSTHLPLRPEHLTNLKRANHTSLAQHTLRLSEDSFHRPPPYLRNDDLKISSNIYLLRNNNGCGMGCVTVRRRQIYRFARD